MESFNFNLLSHLIKHNVFSFLYLQSSLYKEYSIQAACFLGISTLYYIILLIFGGSMRRLFFITVLCGACVAVIGAPWNVLDSDAQANRQPTKSLSQAVSNTLLPQLLERRAPLSYCVEGVPKLKKYAALLEKGYTQWASATAQMIRQANRAEEFADLLPFLEKPLLFQQQFCSYNPRIENSFHPFMEETYWDTSYYPQMEQIRLIILPEREVRRVCSGGEYGEAVACTSSQAGPHVIVMAQLEEADFVSWWSSLMHEIGHTLGMGEGYILGTAKNNPFLGTKPGRRSIMQAEGSTQFSCDDADAFIVFSDALSIPGKPARTGRTARSFQSLCEDDPIWYVDGLQQNRPPRLGGDDRGFSQTSYRDNGKVERFKQFPPQPKDFYAALRLFDSRLSKTPSSKSGGMTYYAAEDGRTFVVEELEDPSVKRVFTLRGKNLLGQTFLDFSSKDSVQALTSLNLEKNKTRLLRIESIFRRTDNPDYGTYFIYSLFEGVVNDGVLSKASARIAYAYKDWILVSFIEPGDLKTTTVLLEKNPDGSGQRMQVLQIDREQEPVGDNFILTLTDVKRGEPLSARYQKYLNVFASSASESMHSELSGMGKVNVMQFNKKTRVGDVSTKNVSAWASQVLDLHSKMGRAIEYQLDGGLAPTGKRALAEFQQLFRPSPHVPSAQPVRRK